MTPASRTPSTKKQSINAYVATEFERCARSYDSRANASAQSLRSALVSQPFVRALPDR